MLKRTLVGIVRSQETTGEKAKDPALKTRYYKLPGELVWNEVVTLIKRTPGYKLLHEVKNVGEIVLEKKNMLGRTQDITLTIIAVNPVITAIDIYSASRGSRGDLGSNYRAIRDLYNMFDKKLAQYVIRT
ncbi:DUF1499 domain-containing protein [Paenibacillus larvae]